MTTSLFPKSLLLLSTLLCCQALSAKPHHQHLCGSDALFAGAGLAATSAQLVSRTTSRSTPRERLLFGPGLSMVLKVAANGVVSIVAGNGLTTGGGDGGLAIGASLSYPAGLAFDPSGNLYIADTYNSNVRKVDTTESSRR